MGAIFRPKYRGRDGVMRDSAVWWVRFRQHGKTVRQSTDTDDERKARAFLREREGKVALKIPVSPQGDRLTLDNLAATIRADYANNGHKTGDTLDSRIAHLLSHLGGATRLSRLTTADVERYKTLRLAAKAAPATVNRELGVLTRMATLATRQFGLVSPFRAQKLEERNVRSGFFEASDLEAICRHLRPELVGFARTAYITGWRKSELRSRQWSHVDFRAGWLRLEPEETKNRDGRMFPLVPELRAVLEAQRSRVEAIQKATGRIVPWIFARDDGAPIGDFKKAWTTACLRAGFFAMAPAGETGKPKKMPAKLIHDFRRTAVRNLERAGVPRSAAMKMVGHKTEAIYRRYAIVDEAMLHEAGAKLAALATTQGAEEASRAKIIALDGKVAK